MDILDLIIIGSGPAGLTASIYASCYHLKHMVVGEKLGGQMQFAPDILNYPGFEDVSGKELTERMVSQVKKRRGEIITQSVIKISKSEIRNTKQIPNLNDQIQKGYLIETLDGKKYIAKAVILATGMERRKLGVPGEIEYTGRGVHYCATCEKQDYDGKICAVVGGGNSAVQAAVQLSQSANMVCIIYRGTELRGDPIWIEKIKKSKKIEVIFNTQVREIVGDGKKMTGIKINSKFKIQNSKSQFKIKKENNTDIFEYKILIDKIFIEIGGVPGTALVIPLGVEMDTGGYIKVNSKLATNVAGIFAAGDLVSYGLSIEQIASAVGLGARAAASAFAYLKGEKTPTVWGKAQIKR